MLHLDQKVNQSKLGGGVTVSAQWDHLTVGLYGAIKCTNNAVCCTVRLNAWTMLYDTVLCSMIPPRLVAWHQLVCYTSSTLCRGHVKAPSLWEFLLNILENDNSNLQTMYVCISPQNFQDNQISTLCPYRRSTASRDAVLRQEDIAL